MIKKLGAFILVLLGIGTGLSLYLPQYPTVEVPKAQYVLVEDSIDKPIDAALLRNSLTIFGDATSHALQLGVFANLQDAGYHATTVNQQQIGLPTPLIVFKAQDPQRQWYVLALGPFSTQEESLRYKRLLFDSNIQSQEISWPIAEEEKK